jgi:hypothetical protein
VTALVGVVVHNCQGGDIVLWVGALDPLPPRTLRPRTRFRILRPHGGSAGNSIRAGRPSSSDAYCGMNRSVIK